MQEYLTHSEAETEQAGADFARALPDGKVVAMYGELGSGKTAFVRGMARGMGLTCRVSSPTFTIVNEYEGPRELIHFDMYRFFEVSLDGLVLTDLAKAPPDYLPACVQPSETAAEVESQEDAPPKPRRGRKRKKHAASQPIS